MVRQAGSVGETVLHGSYLPTTYRLDMSRHWDAVTTYTPCDIVNAANVLVFEGQRRIAVRVPQQWRTWPGAGCLDPLSHTG